MTLPATPRRAGPFAGNGSTTIFPFSFKAFAKEDLRVGVTVSGAETTLVLDSDYSVALNVDQDSTPGGVVVYPLIGSPMASGKTLAIVGNLPFDQVLELTGGGKFSPEAIAANFDRTVMQLQQLDNSIDGVLRVPEVGGVTTLPSATDRANRLVGFDANGNPIGVLPTAGGASALALDLANSTSAAKGAAMVAYNPAQAYAGGVGAFLNTTYARTTAEATAAVTPTNYAYVPGHVRRYGAVGDGVTDDRAACQTAITVAQVSGGEVIFDAGSFLIRRVASGDIGASPKQNGLLIKDNNTGNPATAKPVHIKTAGWKTRLLAGDNDMVILRNSSSYLTMDPIALEGNSKTLVWGLGFLPENYYSNTFIANTNSCNIGALFCNNMTEGLVMQCGAISGTASGCWGNNFFGILTIDCLRAIWLQDTLSGTTASGVNNNNFYGYWLHSGGNINFNSGVYIECGSGNNFMGGKIEGATYGVSPNASPTGIYVAGQGLRSGTVNGTNIFDGFQIEACTTWIRNESNSTVFIGTNPDLTKVTGSVKAQILSGLVNQINSDLQFWAAGSPTQGARISNGSGININYNGLALQSNTNLDGTQSNAGLTSNELHIGGNDSASFPVSRARVTAFHRTAGGARAVSGGIGADGLFLIDGTTAPAPAAGFAFIYIDTATGAPKIKYGNGTVKTFTVT